MPIEITSGTFPHRHLLEVRWVPQAFFAFSLEDFCLELFASQLLVHGDCYGVCIIYIYTLWLFNIAMGNGPFIEVYLLKMVIFHGELLVITRWYSQLLSPNVAGILVRSAS